MANKLKKWFKNILRPNKQPHRQTDVYPQLQNMLSYGGRKDKRPQIKPTAANLRRFAHSPYARVAINSIKNPIAMLKWEVIAKPGVTESAEIKRQIEVVTACLAQPNTDDSFRLFIEQITEDYLVCGAGAFEQIKSSDETRPLWLFPVDGLSIQINPAWSGSSTEARYFQALGFGGNIGGVSGIPLRNDELVYIRKDPSTDSPWGTGALETAYTVLNRLLTTQDYAGNVAGNAQPENILWFKSLSPESLEAVKNYWRNEVEGQGVTPIIGQPEQEQDIKVLKLRGADDKALYLAYQEALIREIAVAFGLSPQNLGVERDVNRDTSEVAEDRDWVGAIVPTAQLLQSHINRECVEGKLGYSQIMFRFVGVEREDERANADRYAVEYSNNVLTPNEYREKIGLPPSKNPFSNLLYADVQLAVKKAGGTVKGTPNKER